MTDTESTESIKDDVPDDDTNYVLSSQDDDYEAKQRKQTRSQTQRTNKGNCYCLGMSICDEIVIIRKVFPPLKEGVVNLWKDGPMAPFEKIKEIIFHRIQSIRCHIDHSRSNYIKNILTWICYDLLFMRI